MLFNSIKVQSSLATKESMSYQTLEVDILVNGKPVKKFAHKGKTYIQANRGTEYSIRIKNNLYFRKLIVCSIDGINVISGKAAGSDKEGYIIQGYDSIEIKGFRTSNEEVHAFKFNDKEESYAAKSEETKGDITNCGVIGIRAYNEKYQQPQCWINYNIPPSNNHYHYHYDKPYIYPLWGNYGSSAGGHTSFGGSSLGVQGSLGPQGCAGYNADLSLNSVGASTMRCASVNLCSISNQSTTQDFDMGTEFSDNKINDRVVEVEFQIGSLAEEITFYYASRESLIQRGVPIIKEHTINKFPSAFPSRFCKPPVK